MLKVLYHVLFFIFTLFIIIEALVYSIDEFKNEKNTFGGVFVISFALFCCVFSNIIIWIN